VRGTVISPRYADRRVERTVFVATGIKNHWSRRVRTHPSRHRDDIHWLPLPQLTTNRLFFSTLLSRARFLAWSSSHSGNWLNALLIASCDLCLSDEEIRIAIGFKLGINLGAHHQCGTPVDALGLHSLSFGQVTGRHQRHNQVTSNRAVKEPPALGVVRVRVQSRKLVCGCRNYLKIPEKPDFCSSVFPLPSSVKTACVFKLPLLQTQQLMSVMSRQYPRPQKS